jgi:hypothetical protein
MMLVVAAAAGNDEWIMESIDRICDRGDDAIYATIVGLTAVLAAHIAPDFDPRNPDPNSFYSFEVIDNLTDEVVEPSEMTAEHRADLIIPRLVTAYCNDDMATVFALVRTAFDADRIDFFLHLIRLVGQLAAHTVRKDLDGRIAQRCPLCECPDDLHTLPSGSFTKGPPGPFGPATYTPHHSWCTLRKVP